MKLKYKLLILILGTVTAVYLLAFGFISYNNYSYSKTISIKYTNAVTNANAYKLVKDINADFAIARTLAHGFSKYSSIIREKDLKVYKSIMKNVLEKNLRYYAVSLSIEMSAINENYKKDFGRLRIAYINEGGVAKSMIDTLNLQGDNVESPYYRLKLNPHEELSEPYEFSPYKDDRNKSLISSVSVPLMKDEKFIGLIQFDIVLNEYKRMIYDIKPFDETNAFILSNSGLFVSSSIKRFQDKKLEDIEDNTTENVLQKIKQGKHFSYTKPDSVNNIQYYSFYPLKFGKSPDYWSLCVTAPYDNMLYTTSKDLYVSIVTLTVGLLIMAIIIWYIAVSISKPLNKLSETINRLSLGDVSTEYKITINRNDEIGDINKLLNSLIDSLDGNIHFATEIGHGNLSYDFKPISEHDILGSALLDMRKSLKQAEIEEKLRKSDDQKLNWSTQGFAKFGELMRENTGNLVEFSYNIISNLVKYLDANQGGLFLINNSDKTNPYIELLASYAYNRRKYIEKKISMGVGLVGRCINESETIYMTDFPNDYLNISSGLGQSSPKSLLLVPIVFNTQVFGVIEMASLHDMKRYQIEFVERIGESMGSSISNVKINEQTAVLLQESKVKSEQLIEQDRELREQIEKLKLIKTNLNDQLFDNRAVLMAFDKVLLIAEFNMQGRLVNINQNYLNLIGKTKHEVIGIFQGAFAVTKEDPRNLFRDFWNELRKGITKSSYQKISINEKEIHLFESYMPIIDRKGKPYKVINCAIDVSSVLDAEY